MSKAAQPRRYPVVVALDFSTARDALALAAQLDPERCKVKVGKELFTRAGPACVEKLVGSGFDVFLDLKFHDIPNTVAGACRAAAELGVWMFNVHASGGAQMLAAARAAVDGVSHRPLLIGVTVLTSLDDDDLVAVGFRGSVAQTVTRLAKLTAAAGLDGVVCSPADLPVLAEVVPKAFLRVTPGIRPRDAATLDQQRVTTPREALAAGADYLVIGRPITAAPDPMAALDKIEQELCAG